MLWVKILLKLKEKSLTFDNPQEIVDSMSEQGGVQFISNIFEEYAPRLMTDNMDNKIYLGIRNAQDIAFCTNWDTFDEKEISYGRPRRRG